MKSAHLRLDETAARAESRRGACGISGSGQRRSRSIYYILLIDHHLICDRLSLGKFGVAWHTCMRDFQGHTSCQREQDSPIGSSETGSFGLECRNVRCRRRRALSGRLGVPDSRTGRKKIACLTRHLPGHVHDSTSILDEKGRRHESCATHG